MNIKTDDIDLEAEFLSKHGKGAVVETNISSIIYPSQILALYYEGFIGRLSLLEYREVFLTLKKNLLHSNWPKYANHVLSTHYFGDAGHGPPKPYFYA